MLWNEFYEKMIMEPRAALVRALDYFSKHPPINRAAYDLGCGNGRDSNALLSAGWNVTAVDSEPAAEVYLKRNIDKELYKNLDFVCKSFDEIDWKTVYLINSSYSLPFCNKESFRDVMNSIANSISPGGLFTGNLFGDRDEWKDKSLVTKQEVFEIFSGFDILFFEESETDGPTAIGTDKHWHIFEITALKI